MKVEDASKKKLYNEAVNKQNKSHTGYNNCGAMKKTEATTSQLLKKKLQISWTISLNALRVQYI